MTEGIPNVLIILPSEPPPEIIVFADNPKLRALSCAILTTASLSLILNPG